GIINALDLGRQTRVWHLPCRLRLRCVAERLAQAKDSRGSFAVTFLFVGIGSVAREFVDTHHAGSPAQAVLADRDSDRPADRFPPVVASTAFVTAKSSLRRIPAGRCYDDDFSCVSQRIGLPGLRRQRCCNPNDYAEQTERSLHVSTGSATGNSFAQGHSTHDKYLTLMRAFSRDERCRLLFIPLSGQTAQPSHQEGCARS